MRRFRDTGIDKLLASAGERRPNGVLEPFKPYLNTHFTESLGQADGKRLFLEIRERGYRGSIQVARKYLAALRAGTAEPVRVDIPSPRKITSWIMLPATPSATARKTDCSKSGSPAPTSPAPATSPALSSTWSATGAVTC
ncbi:hypothetical protein [Streptomyces enissocaesilis]|uniref:Transposase n=1 Tax=Streptomyces enissocaesilis TaxID=332589 RepID=A0ABN3X8G6_9ACTN